MFKDYTVFGSISQISALTISFSKYVQCTMHYEYAQKSNCRYDENGSWFHIHSSEEEAFQQAVQNVNNRCDTDLCIVSA